MEAWSPSSKAPVAEGEGIPFFPNHLLRSFMVAVVVVAVVISLAALFPRPIGDQANPYVVPDDLVSTWVVVDVSIAIIRYLGLWGLALFTFTAVGLALLPLFDRTPESRLSRRPWAVTIGALFLVGLVVAWTAGHRLGPIPPTATPAAIPLEESTAPPAPGARVPDISTTPVRPAPVRDSAVQGRRP
jgi:quinol-cytochrome oxidoreductase complex cytochrome b subunit